MKTAYIISYDIVCNKRRNKIAKRLQKHKWNRIQYSVWMKQVSLMKVKNVVEELDKMGKTDKNDSIICLHLPEKLLPVVRDNNRIIYYLSDGIENLFY